MGLDMYLESRNNESGTENEIAYWRKFNALHSWLVENVQNGVDDCNEYPVSRDQLVTLVDLLKNVQNEKDPTLLPTKSGFFFGSTEYDEYYWSDVSDSITVLEGILQTFDFENNQMIYQSSW